MREENLKQEFQFHIGSIKNLKAIRFREKPVESFNSILVQLKKQFNRLVRGCCLCFNSILVQLKKGERMREENLKQEFQFHIGSIKNLKKKAHLVKNSHCFNSILVQLKKLRFSRL